MAAALDFSEQAERRPKPLRPVDAREFSEPQLVGEVVAVLLAKIAPQHSELSAKPPSVNCSRR